ncbi:MAG: LicD family protein [Treponemataceae bacterium]|nr:LicD family protein [Treponemataceae bacterium]
MDDAKEVWSIELEILNEVRRICEKNDIKYFADSGTLLGAIRHNGFIPWDDDIDISMFREDYDRFRKVAEECLSEKFFCQSGYNDTGFYGGMLHIRMNGTTAILKRNYPHARYHQGIFIDIFPLDGVIENRFLLKIQTFIKKSLNAVMAYKSHGRSIRSKIRDTVLFLPALLPQKLLFALFERVCGWKKADKSEFISCVSYFGTTAKLKRSCYERTETHVFETTTIPVPAGYDAILSSLYGSDYMTPKKTASDHGDVFFDTKHSYRDYLDGKLPTPEELRI